MSKLQMKNEAIKCMEQLNIYKPYITGFKKHDNVCWFDRFGGYWAYQDEWLNEKIHEIEKEYNMLVYAVTHEMFEFGECYSMLVVPNNFDEDDNEMLVEKIDGMNYYVWAYVLNKTYPEYSEFGIITVRSFGGGICRTA